MEKELAEYLIGVGDDLLILGHRLSEWCGHGPILEEDIALANIALDCIGQASSFLTLAATAAGKGQSADGLAFLRDATEFRNYQLVEQPNGDFAVTIVRQVLFDTYAALFFAELSKSTDLEVGGAAGKALKETNYHLRHGRDWFIRLSLGTDEGKARVQSALNDLWGYTFELGQTDKRDEELVKRGLVPELTGVRLRWEKEIGDLIAQAELIRPSDNCYKSSGSRMGLHTEHLGHLLAEMQVLHRAHPNASW